MNRVLKLQSVLLVLAAGLSCWSCSPKPGQSIAQHASPALNKVKPAPDIWKSETTGKEYRVKIDGDHLYADWVNLPPVAAQHGAYIHTVCQRAGTKWVGTSSIFMPCTIGQGKAEHVANTCHLTLKFEIDSISKDRITGRGQSLEKFNCQSCTVIKTGWGKFVWVPAR